MRRSTTATPRVQAAPANPVEHVRASYYGDRRRLKSDAQAFEKSAQVLTEMGDHREAARVQRMADIRYQAAKRPRRARRHLAALAALASLTFTGCGTAALDQYPDCVELAQNRLGCYQERVGDEPAEVKLPLINGNKYQREVAEGELVWESIIPWTVPAHR